MGPTTIGSQLLPYRHQLAINEARRVITQASTEMATERVADTRSHLRGNLTPLARIETQIVRMDRVERLLGSQATRFDAAQLSMGRVLSTGQSFVAAMDTKIGMDPTAITPFDISATARTALEDTLAALNASVAGQRVFGGDRPDVAPLATAPEIMSALSTAVAGLSDVEDIRTAVLAFFETPGTGFDTLVYRGGVAATPIALADNATVPIVPTAADPALRRQLAAISLGALTAESGLGLSQQDGRRLLEFSTAMTRGNTGAIAVMQGELGQAQATIARAQENTSIDRDAAIIARNALIGADPFVAATRLDQGRVQLESLYAVTARLSGLSLVRFLS